MAITNARIKSYAFLQMMSDDESFPDFLVDKGKSILLRLCETIEQKKPLDLESLYALTHAATEEFNALSVEFEDNDSEIETTARECIAEDFSVIAEAYGFDADMEALVATRDW